MRDLLQVIDYLWVTGYLSFVQSFDGVKEDVPVEYFVDGRSPHRILVGCVGVVTHEWSRLFF